MFGSYILAIAILLSGTSGIHFSPQQETDTKSSPQSAPSSKTSAATPDKSAAPDAQPEKPKETSQSSQSEATSSGQSQPAPQAGEPEKPKDASPQSQSEEKQQPEGNQQSEEKQPPEDKKAAACVGEASAQGKCAKQVGGRSHRVVIRKGGVSEPTAQLAPGMSPAQAARHRQTTEQYLNSADQNLRKLAGRNLNQNQDETVSQIRNYILGSRSALGNGDLLRARNLAFKAHLLADDLVKH